MNSDFRKAVDGRSSCECFPVPEPALEVLGAHLHPLALREMRVGAVGRLHPAGLARPVRVRVAGGDGVVLALGFFEFRDGGRRGGGDGKCVREVFGRGCRIESRRVEREVVGGVTASGGTASGVTAAGGLRFALAVGFDVEGGGDANALAYGGSNWPLSYPSIKRNFRMDVPVRRANSRLKKDSDA
ncbi:MAG: hypothetical protein IJS46_02200 [Kiritimatiellae bacterium]|nr:hypothetical protein [Kiritimatiellia bacterium]